MPYSESYVKAFCHISSLFFIVLHKSGTLALHIAIIHTLYFYVLAYAAGLELFVQGPGHFNIPSLLLRRPGKRPFALSLNA